MYSLGKITCLLQIRCRSKERLPMFRNSDENFLLSKQFSNYKIIRRGFFISPQLFSATIHHISSLWQGVKLPAGRQGYTKSNLAYCPTGVQPKLQAGGVNFLIVPGAIRSIGTVSATISTAPHSQHPNSSREYVFEQSLSSSIPVHLIVPPTPICRKAIRNNFALFCALIFDRSMFRGIVQTSDLNSKSP